MIEDDSETAAFIARGLREAGATVDCAETGVDGMFLASEGGYDVMVVDRLLPKMDGLGLVRVLRAAGVATPVLFLTAVNGLDDRVEGLDAGGDDYMCKPFAFSELNARLRALVRRAPGITIETVLRVGDLSLDRVSRRVERAGQKIDLQPREYRLLEFLMQHAEEVVTRTMLLEHVWEFHFEPKTSVVETHMSRLRSKVDKPFDVELIQTVRGAGYVIAAPTRLGAEIARSAAFRLTIRFAAVFVVCLLVADLADRLQRALDRAREDDRGARRNPRGNAVGPCDRRIARGQQTLARLASEEEDGEVMLGHQGPAGNLIAGSLARAAPGPELRISCPPGNDPDEGMWVRSRPYRTADGSMSP